MSEVDPLAALSRSSRSRTTQTHALKDLVRKQFDLPETEPVFIAEISCGEADCPDLETVVALFVDGQRQEFRLPKAVERITGSDIASLVPSSQVKREPKQ
ncbi:MAG: hypothetical protein AAFO75_11975 [Pseudomonadota bacterium]